MSFRSRSRQPVPPVRHRSSSASRTPSSPSSAALSSYSRPRSLFSTSNTNPFNSASNLYSSYVSPYTSGNSAYSSPYSSGYKSPYFSNGYKGSSGYASLTIPANKFNFLGTSNYDNGRSRSISRQGSFGRERSLSKSRSPSVVSGSGMGSRSISLTSLNSEGYVVRATQRSICTGSLLVLLPMWV